MMRCGHRRLDAATLCVLGVLLSNASPAIAQRAVGSGPLTASLPDIEPQSGVLRFGPVTLAPGAVIREIGWDSNIFDEAQNPKEDFVVAVAPDVALFTRLRFVQLSAYGGGDFNYFNNYQDERSIGGMARARVDILLSRVRPFLGAGRNSIRTRPNGEIDVRADRVERELSGGLAFEVSPYLLVYGSASHLRTEYQDALEEGIDLGASLNRDRTDYQSGLRYELSPISSLTVFGSFGTDRFRRAPLRDGDSVGAHAALTLGAEAIVSGQVMVAYKDFKPVDPLVERFRGVTGTVNLGYSVFDVGRVGVVALRGTEYSFDVAAAYYLENTIVLSYTHRLAGAFDAQIKGGRSFFDYGFRQDIPEHRDTLTSGNASVGYNLRNRTRISINYEASRRRSPALPNRNYERRRAYLAWTFGY